MNVAALINKLVELSAGGQEEVIVRQNLDDKEPLDGDILSIDTEEDDDGDNQIVITLE